MKPDIRSLYQEFELADPEALVGILLGTGGMRSHRTGATVFATGNQCYQQAKAMQKRNQELSKRLLCREPERGGSGG